MVDNEYHCYTPMDLQWNRLSRPSKQDLAANFDVVGLTADFVRTTCMMFISLLNKVPPRCDCTRRAGAGADSDPRCPWREAPRQLVRYPTTAHEDELIDCGAHATRRSAAA